MKDFIIHFFKITQKNNPNNLISPLSLEILLQILLQGSTNELQKLLKNILGNTENLDQQLEQLSLRLDNLKIANTNNKLKVANLIYHRKELTLVQKFAAAINQHLGLTTITGELDKLKINDWGQQQTNHLIPNLAELMLVDWANPAFIIANALYIEANWANDFNTHPLKTEGFQCADGSFVETLFMEQYNNANGASGLGYFSTSSFQAIQLPLNGNSLCMDIYLPHQHDQLPALLSQLDSIHTLWAWDKRFEETPYINILLPKFDLEQQQDLKALATTLGITPLFEFSNDWNQLFEPIGEPLFIQQLAQLNKLKIDEYGIEGAAITYAMGGVGSYSISQKCKLFEANHPFLFTIKDKKSQTVLFLGTYTQPPINESFATFRQYLNEFQQFKVNLQQLSYNGQLAALVSCLEAFFAQNGLANNLFVQWYIEEVWNFIALDDKTLATPFIKLNEELLNTWDYLYDQKEFESTIPDTLPKTTIAPLIEERTKIASVLQETCLFLHQALLFATEAPVLTFLEEMVESNLYFPLWNNFKSFLKDESEWGQAIQQFTAQTTKDLPKPSSLEWSPQEQIQREQYAKLRQLKAKFWDFSVRANVYFCWRCLELVLATQKGNDSFFERFKLDIQTFLNSDFNTAYKIAYKYRELDTTSYSIDAIQKQFNFSTQQSLIFELLSNISAALQGVKYTTSPKDDLFSHYAPSSSAQMLWEHHILLPKITNYAPLLVGQDDYLGQAILIQ